MEPNHFRSDAEVSLDVARVLTGHPPLQGVPITAQVRDGRLTMSGTLPTWKHARDACRLAHTVAGVVEVRDELLVEPSEADRRTDRELALAAREALRDNLLVSGDILVTVADGVVTLEGTVPYASQRYDAEVALERLAGLRGVIDRVRVAAAEHVDLTAARDVVIQALKKHAAADGLGLTLEEREGTLRVAGTLDSAEEKGCVLRALRGLAGVRHVVDEIRIGSPSSSSSRHSPAR